MGDSGADDFGREYEVNSRRAHISAYVLVAGLVLELVNALIWYEAPKTLAEMSAVLLIVGGVWGEIFFGHKARVAGDNQLAQYAARTAEADARALEARLALEKYKAPRTLSLSQMSDIASKMSKWATLPRSGAIQSAAVFSVSTLRVMGAYHQPSREIDEQNCSVALVSGSQSPERRSGTIKAEIPLPFSVSANSVATVNPLGLELISNPTPKTLNDCPYLTGYRSIPHLAPSDPRTAAMRSARVFDSNVCE
jgi:hypothetical protein